MVAAFLAIGAYAVALPIFLVAALTDFADGYIARRFKQVSKLGATLDPIADKLSMLTATVLLAWQGLLPLWLAIAMVGRDVIIVAGALAYRAAFGHLEVAPTWLSKANTLVEFALLLALMAVGAGWLAEGAWLAGAFLVTAATVAASGAQYIAIWGGKALRERRATKPR